jgi:hypothetical protein
MELSTEFSVLRLESFSIRGAKIEFGSLVTSGARLVHVRQHLAIRSQGDLPFDSQVLDLAVLVV